MSGDFARKAIEHNDKLTQAYRDIDILRNRLAKAEAERDALKKLVYVPGLWRCAKCKFSRQSMNLHAVTGTISAKADATTEPCPNGCGPLWPVTERLAGNDLCDRLEKAEAHAKAWRKFRADVEAAEYNHGSKSERFYSALEIDLALAEIDAATKEKA